jgi:8-oxo-dGTP diphosphatase
MYTQAQEFEVKHKSHHSGPVTKVAAKACIFKGDRMLVLYKPDDARQRSAASDREEDLPGGCVEFGESFVEALVREVDEETGLTIKVGCPFNTWSITKTERHILGVDFVAFWEGGEVRLSHEHRAYEWLTLEEIKAKNWQDSPIYEQAFKLALDYASDIS